MEEFTQETKSSILDKKLEEERRGISQYINENIISKLNDIQSIGDVQVHLASQRQRLIDKIADIKGIIRKRTENIEAAKKQKYRFYKLDYDIKLNDYEIKRHVEADLEETTNLITILENQVDYYKGTIDTLDKIVFKIKYLIEIKKYLSGVY